MIHATSSHVLPASLEGDHGRDAAFFLDMDLAILGAAANEFDAYEHAVRREYEWVDDDRWKSARSAVLRGFLDRPSIFLTAAFRESYEAAARENISRSLERLEGQA